MHDRVEQSNKISQILLPDKRNRASFLLSGFLALIGTWLSLGGAILILLGGSFYYLAAGTGCLLAALLYFRRHIASGALAYACVFAGTLAWSLQEVGLQFWLLMPRVAGPGFLSAVVLVHLGISLRLKPIYPLLCAAIAALSAAMLFLFMVQLPEPTGGRTNERPARAASEDWTAFGRSAGGERFSPASQINAENVGALQLAWTFRTGDMPPGGLASQKNAHVFEATPIKVGDLLYVCTPHNLVIAIDVDTGRQVWRFDPRINTKGVALLACRGVSYYKTAGERAHCRKRILFGTLDARLIALDADTGLPCDDFGDHGTVHLKSGLGVAPDGYYFVTSPPAIADGIAIVGGWVLDGKETGEPSGVIRGFDAVSGKLVWSWDAGSRDENRALGTGEQFSRGSPNSWSVMSVDEKLGLVYVPMGNATPDYVGMHRTPEDERYSSSVVALEGRTGKRRWSFQAVHHDLWDYDAGSQPVLFDMPMGQGPRIPAVALPTKQGDIYVLDRRTGKPLTQVQERRVPRGTIAEERYAPTQPFSTGFPSALPSSVLQEKDMWGISPLDQLYCRILFKQAHYEGMYTPPSTKTTIQYPSNFGAVDWGSISMGENGRTMYVNASALPMTMRLLPRNQVKDPSMRAHRTFAPQLGTPYAAKPVPMLSPLGIPCNAPPWGSLTAIDLETRTVKWRIPFGTSADKAPLGIAVPGAPNIAGSVATGGGLLFIGAAIDDYLRAYDARSGKELWRARLPAGGQAAPISFVSGKTGWQYIVIVAGGHQLLGTTLGDYVLAYALPRSPKADAEE